MGRAGRSDRVLVASPGWAYDCRTMLRHPFRIAALILVMAVWSGAVALLAPRVPDSGAPDFGGACRDGRPFLVTACYAATAGDPAPRLPAVVLFQDTPADGPHHMLAGHDRVGAVWGLAYSAGRRALYAAAFRKRGVALGPGGPGAIYRVDLATGTVSSFATVPDAAPGEVLVTGDDAAARHEAGRVGLGDIDLDESAGMLFAVNLQDRRLYAFDLADGRLLAAFDHGAAGEPWAAEARPFGLGLWGGRLFHALVRDAGASGDPADLEVRVYSSAYDGSGMRLEAAMGLGYARGGLRQAASGEALDLAWRPWADAVPPSPADALSVGPQPMAADIVFDAAGNLVLGLRDRLVDMTDPALAAGSELAIGAGDLLLARREGEGWRFAPDAPGYDDAIAGSSHSAQGGLAWIVSPGALVSADLGRVPSLVGGSELRATWYDGVGGQKQAAESVCPSGQVLPSLWAAPERASAPALRRALADTTTFSAPRTAGDLEALCYGEGEPERAEPGARLWLPWSDPGR